MIGNIINFASIILGSLIGIFFKKGIPEKISNTIFQGLSLAVIFIGISGTLKVNNVMLVIFSLVIGAVIGEALDIEKSLENLGNFIEKKFKNINVKISEGFVTTTLLYCVGSMAIIGPLNAGLKGDFTLLFTKSILDGITSIIFASTLGIGVLLSGFSVLIYQGTITLLSSILKSLLVTSVITDMTVIGSLLILALGFNMLKMTKIKVANLLPSIFIPIFYQLFLNFIAK